MTFVYGDISGEANGPAMVAACYLGRESHWESAVHAWSLALAEAKIDIFHATEFFSGRGAFSAPEWHPKGPKHLEIARRFCAIADNAGLIGFVSAMDCGAFASILAPELRKEKRKQRFSAFFSESRDRNETWTRWFEGFTIGEKGLVPLQIADLLAHEGWRRAKALLVNPAAEPRQSFRRMLFHERIEFQMIDERSCKKNGAIVPDILDRFPDGLIPLR